MRDIFADIFANEAVDPREAARRGLRPKLRKRFYVSSQVGEGPDGFAVLLDGKPVRSPARRVMAAPVVALAEAIAAEWEAQREVIDPATMPITRLANSIIDGVADARTPVAAQIAKYLGSDLICYRVQAPEELRARQDQHWDLVMAWARDALGADFVLVESVVHEPQPEAAIAAATHAIPQDAWQLGALSSVTALTGSALIALALLRGRLSADEAWAAAQVDEDWQMEKWGRDEIALAQRDYRFNELRAAALVLTCLRS